MKNIDVILKWVVVAGIIIVSISVAYYVLWFLPSKERIEQEQYRQERVADCIKKADDENTPVMQKLIDGLYTTKNPSDLESIRNAISVLNNTWVGKKEVCGNLR